MLSLSLFGSFKAALNERPITSFRTIKVQALLIYLLVESAHEQSKGIGHQRESLMTLLWPDLPLKSAQENLRQTIYQLRKVIPAHTQDGGEVPLLMSDRLSVCLNPDYPCQSDFSAFLNHLNNNRLEDAVALYKGDFLADFFLPDSIEFEEWALARRATCRREALQALDQLVEESWQTADFKKAERYARQQLEIDPLREKGLRQLMCALVGNGERIAALVEFERFQNNLRQELGVPPSLESVQLLEQIQAEEFLTPARVEKMAAPDFAALEIPETTPFVAREAELEHLAETWRAAQKGQSQLLFVTGGAGRGKTALVAQFARQLLDKDDSVLVACGYCHAQAGIGDPYLPFRQVLAQLSGDVLSPAAGALLVENQGRRLWSAMPLTIPTLISQAPDLVNSLVPGNELRQRAATFAGAQEAWFLQLSALLARPYQDQLQQVSLFSQVTTLLKQIARERPLLLILEDLHWVDPASSSLLFHLSREMGQSRIFILGTYRPEEIIGSPGENPHPLAGMIQEFKRQRGNVWLNLGQEPEEKGRLFIDALLDSEPNDLDENFRQALFEHTEGHALFAVELLRALQERGELALGKKSRWEVVKEIDWHTLPPRVEGVIAQRFGRLDDKMCSALRTAAVVGDTFAAEVVAQIQNQEPRDLVRRLSNEISRQHHLVQPESFAWVGDQRLSRFRFRHQLFQQYLYQSMSEMDRAYRHEEVGYVLERLYGEQAGQIAAPLAWHFDQAKRIDKALYYLVLAARGALQLGATDKAIEHCLQGLELLQMIPEAQRPARPELSLQATLGSALMTTKGFGNPEVEAAFSRARELAPYVGEAPERLPIMYGTWNYFFTRGRLALALELAQEILQYASQIGEPLIELVGNKSIGVTLLFLGRLQEALEHLDQVPVLADEETRGALIALCGYDISVTGPLFRAIALTLMGNLDCGEAACREAIKAARRLDHPFTLTFVLAMKTILHTLRLDMMAGLAGLEEQITLATRHGIQMWRMTGEYSRLVVEGFVGNPENVLDAVKSMREVTMASGVSTMASLTAIGVAELLQRAGNVAEALTYLDHAEEFINNGQERFYESELYRWRGELKRDVGTDAWEVAAEFEHAIAIAQEQESKLLELRATVSLCHYLQQQGQLEEARQRLVPLLDWFTEGFEYPDLQAASILLNELGQPVS
jgi:DNA-binding SARP family transcriptional activator/tetratricopeptide (TPR) repeat protein